MDHPLTTHNSLTKRENTHNSQNADDEKSDRRWGRIDRSEHSGRPMPDQNISMPSSKQEKTGREGMNTTHNLMEGTNTTHNLIVKLSNCQIDSYLPVDHRTILVGDAKGKKEKEMVQGARDWRIHY
jgi:hypothetical protein